MVFKRIFIIACLFIALKAAAQDQIVARGDTLILPNGAKFWLGEQVTLGSGSLPNGSFNFIYFPILDIKKKALKASYAGQTAVIKKFQRDGAYKKTYSYNIIVLEFNDSRVQRFWCDVQGAVSSNEIITNHAKGGGQADSKEARLANLKKLYDSGQLSKDDYETLKNKILNEKDTGTKKPSDAPVVF